MRLAAVLALAGCWTSREPPRAHRLVEPSVYAGPPMPPRPPADDLDRIDRGLGDDKRGCQLMVDKGCAGCHPQHRDATLRRERYERGLAALSEHVAEHGQHHAGPLARRDREDLAACLWLRWF